MAIQSNDDFLKEIDELLQGEELDPPVGKVEANHHEPLPSLDSVEPVAEKPRSRYQTAQIMIRSLGGS